MVAPNFRSSSRIIARLTLSMFSAGAAVGRLDTVLDELEEELATG